MAAHSARHEGTFGADDRARTGDLDFGKAALYQLSYVRVNPNSSRGADDNRSRLVSLRCRTTGSPPTNCRGVFEDLDRLTKST